MITGWAMWGLATLALLLPAVRVVRICQHAWPELRVSSGILYFLGQIAVVVLLLGMAQQLRAVPMLIASFICGTAGLFLLRPSRFEANPASLRMSWVWILLLPVVFRGLFHTWLFPPYVWDTLSYHLVNMAQWVQRGGFHVFDTPATTAYFPAGFGLFQTWQVVFAHHDGIVELAGLPFYILMLLFVAVIARSCGLAGNGPAWVAVLAGYTPCLVQHSVSANNDIGAAAMVLGVFAMILLPPDAGERHLALRRNIAVFCFLLGMSIKPYLAFSLPGFLTALIVVGFLEGEPFLKGLLRWWPDSRLAWAVALLSLGVGAFFYLRNFVWFGNPLYPAVMAVGDEVAGGSGSAGEIQGSFGLVPMMKSMDLLFSEKIWDRGRIYPDLARMAGWGWTVMAMGLPAFSFSLVAGPARMRLLLLSALLSMMGIFLAVWPDNTNARFLLWFPPVVMIAIGWCLAQLTLPAIRRGILALATCSVLLNFVGVLDVGRLKPIHWKLMAWMPFHHRSAAEMTSFTGKEFPVILKHVKPGERIYFVGGPFCSIYPIYGADLSRELVFHPLGGRARLLDALREQDLKHVYVTQREEMRSPEYASVMEQLQQDPFQHVAGGYYVLP